MPCYESRGNEVRTVYESGVNPGDHKRAIDLAKGLEAALCALITEIEKEGCEHLIPRAGRHGLINIMSFWESHKKNDKARLANELHKFSVHEQDVLYDMLKASKGSAFDG